MMSPYALRPMRRPLMRDPRLLIDWRAGEPFPSGGYTRPSDGLTRGADGVWRPCAPNVPRIEWYDLGGDGVRETPTVLLESAATNLLLDSCNLPASGSAWGTTSNFTVTPAASIVASQTAWRHQNLGTAGFRFRDQSIGTLTGQPETVSVVVENVDATTTAVSLFDGTAAAHVCRVQLAWATGAATVVAGSGTARATRLASAGPNGGPVYRLIVTGTGTAGDQRQIVVYPSGTSQNTQTAIVHHVQHEVGAVATSPIVTTTAAVTRAADLLTSPFSHRPQSLARYQRFVEGGAALVANARTGQIGSDTGLHRYSFQVSTHPSSGVYQATIGNGTTFVSSTGAAAPDVDDEVEHLALLEIDGTDARVRLLQTINGEDTSGPWSDPLDVSALLAEGWQAPWLTIGNVAEGTRPGRMLLRDDLVLRGSHWTLDDVRRLVG